MESQIIFRSCSLIWILAFMMLIKSSSLAETKHECQYKNEKYLRSLYTDEVKKPFDTEIPDKFRETCTNKIMGKTFSIYFDGDFIVNRDTFLSLQQKEILNNPSVKLLHHTIMNDVDIKTIDPSKKDILTHEPLTDPVRLTFDGIRIGRKTKKEFIKQSKKFFSLLFNFYRIIKFKEDVILSNKITSFIKDNGLEAPDKFYDHNGNFLENPYKLPTDERCIDKIYYRKIFFDLNSLKSICPMTGKEFINTEARFDMNLSIKIRKFLTNCGEYRDYFIDLKYEFN